ncbi:uncharacterized protein PHALS_10626 [Plasmopara halstedii]|uniref:Uncharacterized protein n=1 Tax=Plasmopara halstedii TaxID=4781 RepID=A0A0N7L542_PLAHL|nr:uncharacterized protein PHALS_10626 [Plasmopara halstedii]CEG40427.1 hypothetical protein PHALS_10626 [Plasmopara halstedii]|eukprot:XP_024576796.1 hypothetical protein PHALS_10626 [Plasmopara halstedii]
MSGTLLEQRKAKAGTPKRRLNYGFDGAAAVRRLHFRCKYVTVGSERVAEQLDRKGVGHLCRREVSKVSE